MPESAFITNLSHSKHLGIMYEHPSVLFKDIFYNYKSSIIAGFKQVLKKTEEKLNVI